MLKNKILEKLLAIVLIFTLTFANFAFITKSYASFAGTVFGGKTDTGSKNVEFEAYFGTEEEKETSVISNVNNKDLAISMNLNVKDGYLKNAKIQITEAKERKGINFDLKEKTEVENTIRNIEENTIYLNQINKSSETKISVPIEYKNEEYVNEEKVSKDALVIFTGTYIDNKGEEKELSKEINLNVSWKDERKIELETEATKYINYGEGVILQTVEKIESKTEENTLPVKTTELEIEVPILKETKPSKITVVANTTKGTNGQEAGEITFNENNWTYNEEENKLTIKVSNEKQKVEVNKNEDEYLQDAQREKIEEERYYNGSGIDEFVVTYTYAGLEQGKEKIEANSKVQAKMTTISGIEKEENINIVTNNKEYKYELSETTGDIVSLNIENKNQEISKAYTYVNYNNQGKYETEISSEMIVNISYKDIVEGIEVKDDQSTYVDKNGNTIPNNDIYYKNINISKENFNSILGEDGEIKVKDQNGNIINTINKNSEVNEKGNITIGFEEKHSRLSFETTKPIGEGNLVISTTKAISNVSIEKQEYINIEKIKNKTSIKANYNYVEGIVDVGEVETEEKLLDTTTEANLVIDRESLSTVEENKDVEMRIELNNARETSDIYGNSHFEIELPEYVENIDVTNLSLLYGEGLEIKSGEVNGRTIIVDLAGKQEGINSGILTNGTNIVLNANIKVDLYAPAKTEQIKLRYTNSEATNYVDQGNKEVEISYSAPTGLVAVNSISNYNNEGTITTSVRQGKKEGIIPVYGETRTAQNEIIVMNNNNNTVSNMSILGRIPYAGVKDLQTGEELGTTLDSKLVNGIVGNERNRGEFIVYYSENGEATKDLNSQENGWIQNPQNLENIKSYLIVPVDENYNMEETEILRFSYSYSIPENLTHNENMYGTFGVYYTNNSELSKTQEVGIADLVGLSTGAGPELTVSMEDAKEQVKENEEFEVKANVKNVGKNIAENVKVEIPIPSGATYSRYEIDEQNGVASIENGNLVITFEKLEIGQDVEIKIYLIAKPLSNEGQYNEKIQPTIKVTAKDLGAELTANSNEIKIEFAEFYISEETAAYSKIEKAGNEVYFRTKAINTSGETKNNVVITKTLPKEFNLENCTGDYTYNEKSRTITWNVGSLASLEDVTLDTTVKVNEIEENIGIVNTENSSKITAENSDEYESNTIITTVGKPVLSITQSTNNVSTYLKEGDDINYTFTVKNEGGVTATNVNLVDNIPEGIVINRINYAIGNIEKNKTGYFNDKVELDMNIAPGEEWKINLQGEATSLGGAEEQSVSNYATVSSNEIPETKSNSVTHIIESTNENIINGESSSSTTQKASASKTYKITGIAWVDSNQDGMRNNNEELLAGVVVRLVNSETGVISQSITTDSNGTYAFSGVQNGNYLVIFEYDTATYKVTTYQKEGVLANVNSDVITTTIEQDGKTREGAVTDVITVNNGSVSNIDIGLLLANTFDLKLDKSISKVTVQTSKGTTSDNYNNVNLAKAEIAAKNLSGATVYVEYTITVSNVGDLSGYAKKIVDYIPEGMTFNSSLDANSDWYTGSDGNLYTDKLANTQLKSNDIETVKLVLTKQMTEENTGLVNNLAEIYEDYNSYGIADINSTPANKAQGENDLSSADIIVAVKTGEILVYISVIIISILLGSIAIFVAYNKLIVAKRKGGV